MSACSLGDSDESVAAELGAFFGMFKVGDVAKYFSSIAMRAGDDFRRIAQTSNE